MTLSPKSVVEVVLFEVRDQCGVHRSPSQEFLGPYTRPREIEHHQGTEKTKVGVCLFTGNADHRQVKENHAVMETPQIICYTSTAAVFLFMRHPDALDKSERMDLAALRQAHPDLESAYRLTQGFLQMLRKREREQLDTWLVNMHESDLPELESFAHGVKQDQAAVQAGLTLPINNGQTPG